MKQTLLCNKYVFSVLGVAAFSLWQLSTEFYLLVQERIGTTVYHLFLQERIGTIPQSVFPDCA
jgi:hypothetical protein